ncbi:hypothetical protein LVD17_23080 [Fulvivirga ulvae]|uniref:hypothetical protein n=1 Tax=Fulvivirga ulvae TaxID=2904245 RepID=UPI001F380377|nr:hypothetical protein [Fulvivirga ulvae]UII31179.1 hypothetical protein LVD17_23080 [Fulvivirga ulvae]
MKYLLIIIYIFTIQTAVWGQEVFKRYLEYDKIWDVQGYYSKNMTPGAHAGFFGVKTTYIKNILFLDGDGYRDPDIGLSINPSANIGKFHTRKSQVKNVLLQDGVLNFQPSLFIRVLPDEHSRFTFFANAGGGVKLFYKLRNIEPGSSPNYLPSDDDNGLFDQWVFEVGAGIDYDEIFSVHAKYVRGWHDVTKSTEDYYRKYINSSTTFVKYFNVRANFAICKSTTAFIEWDGYRNSFDNERIVLAGVSVYPCLLIGKLKEKKEKEGK